MHSDTRSLDRLVVAVVELSWGPRYHRHLLDCWLASAVPRGQSLACRLLNSPIRPDWLASGKERSRLEDNIVQPNLIKGQTMFKTNLKSINTSSHASTALTAGPSRSVFSQEEQRRS